MGAAQAACQRRKKGVVELDTESSGQNGGLDAAPDMSLARGPVGQDIEEPPEKVAPAFRPSPASPARASRPPVCGPGEYVISLDMSPGDGEDLPKLGVEVELIDDCLLRVDLIGAGRIEDWNMVNPEAAVKVGDCIVEANGHRGDSRAVVAACKQPGTLTLVLQRRAPPRRAMPPQVSAQATSTQTADDEVRLPVGEEVWTQTVGADGGDEGAAAGDGGIGEAEFPSLPPLRTPADYTPEECEDYEITLDRSSVTTLGVDVVPVDSAETGRFEGLLVEGIREGLVEEWNRCQETHATCVAPGDWIIEANGVRDDVQAVIRQCMESKDLKLVLRRPPREATAAVDPANEN